MCLKTEHVAATVAQKHKSGSVEYRVAQKYIIVHPLPKRGWTAEVLKLEQEIGQVESRVIFVNFNRFPPPPPPTKLRIECSGLGVKRDTPCNAL